MSSRINLEDYKFIIDTRSKKLNIKYNTFNFFYFLINFFLNALIIFKKLKY